MEMIIKASQKEGPRGGVGRLWKYDANYRILCEIGRGSYGKVYEALNIHTNTRVAIKKFIKALVHPKLAQYCLRELEIITRVTHPNIVKKERIVRSSRSVYIVMDYMPLDLKKLVRSRTFLDHEQVRTLMYEILLALNYLHSTKIVHRDIKPGNILASPDCRIMLCDFGLSRSICGLSITSYDFDEIYRREFADSNEQNIVAGLADQSDTDDQADIEEDLDEHVLVNTRLSIPGCFDVNMGHVSQGKAETMQLLPSTNSPSLIDGLFRMRSCNSVKVPAEKPKEERKSRTLGCMNVTARRAELIKTVREKPMIERQLTSHIASRWYRAPEVILMEKVYCSAVDVWGLGCVFAELIQMIKENRSNYTERAPLFPGTSCFPLSPILKPDGKREYQSGLEGDQLVSIFKVLGTPTHEDLSFVADDGTKYYINSLPKHPGTKFKTAFPASTPEELDLLRRMLCFNPFMRITVKEALRHSYFKNIRCKPRETEGVPIQLDTAAASSQCIQKLREFCDREKK